MTEEADFLDSLHLSSLDTGTVVELHTRNRCYRIEYLEGDRVRISGHPKWCPTPALARLHGSKGGSYGFEEGYIRCGLRLLFERLDDCTQVATSEITGIRVVNLN
jgi:hypothetical protein